MRVLNETTGEEFEAVFREQNGELLLAVSDGLFYNKEGVLRFTIIEEDQEEQSIKKAYGFRFQGE